MKTRISSAVGTAIAVAAATLLAISPAYANPDWSWDDDDIVGEQPGGGDGGFGGGPSTPIYTAPGPWTQTVYVPYCPTNTVFPVGEGTDYEMTDALCTNWQWNCPEGEGRYWIYTRQREADGSVLPENRGFSQSGSVCRGPNDPAPDDGPVQITIGDIADRARAVAPEPLIGSEPGSRTYVNLPTNFYTDATDQQRAVDVLGFSITLTFTPEDVSWDFGDGGSATGAGVQGASVGDAGAVEHLYRRAGSHTVTMSTGWSVVATLPSGQNLTMPGLLTTSSAPLNLSVGEIQSIVTAIS